MPRAQRHSLPGRQYIIVVGTALAMLLQVGCSPTAPPAATSSPAPAASPAAPKPAAAASPAAPASPVASPAASPAARSGASSDAGAAWAEVIAAAQREGVLNVHTHPGTGVEQVINRFRQRYPWLKVEHLGMRNSQFVPRVLTEQRNDMYAWDLQFGNVYGQAGVNLRPAGAMADLAPALEKIPQESRDSTQWAGGFWLTNYSSHTDAFINQLALDGGFRVDRSKVPATELSSMAQLTDPRFRGRIVMYDPGTANASSQALATFLLRRGEDETKRLLSEMGVIRVETARQAAEWLTTGRYPIGIGVDRDAVLEFQAQGIGASVEEVRETEFAYLRPSGVIGFKNPPHPNAATLFLGWFLSQEGQDAWASLEGNTASTRRLDVKIYNPESTPDWSKLAEYTTWAGTPEYETALQRVIELANQKR